MTEEHDSDEWDMSDDAAQELEMIIDDEEGGNGFDDDHVITIDDEGELRLQPEVQRPSVQAPGGAAYSRSIDSPDPSEGSQPGVRRPNMAPANRDEGHQSQPNGNADSTSSPQNITEGESTKIQWFYPPNGDDLGSQTKSWLTETWTGMVTSVAVPSTIMTIGGSSLFTENIHHVPAAIGSLAHSINTANFDYISQYVTAQTAMNWLTPLGVGGWHVWNHQSKKVDSNPAPDAAQDADNGNGISVTKKSLAMLGGGTAGLILGGGAAGLLSFATFGLPGVVAVGGVIGGAKLAYNYVSGAENPIKTALKWGTLGMVCMGLGGEGLYHSTHHEKPAIKKILQLENPPAEQKGITKKDSGSAPDELQEAKKEQPKAPVKSVIPRQNKSPTGNSWTPDF